MSRGRLALVLTAAAAALGVPGQLTLRARYSSEFDSSRPATLVLPSLAGARAEDPWQWELLMPRRQFVTFDPRGTGRGALRCRDLEAATLTDAGLRGGSFSPPRSCSGSGATSSFPGCASRGCGAVAATWRPRDRCASTAPAGWTAS